VYWPLLVIEPGPAFASPPDTDQLTLAAAPELVVAVNCSTGVPEELLELQPVQLVSIEPVFGETENSPFEEVVVAPPPQPATIRKAGITDTARTRPGQDWRDDANLRPPKTPERRRRPTVTDAFSFKSSRAFPLALAPQPH
jgi:hypothetical protein